MVNSLGFDKSEKETTVVVAMSGGVDSSVVAAMLHQEGYHVIGLTLQLYDHGAVIQKKGACCAGLDIYDARKVADDMGFKHYVLDYESRFSQKVIDDFADSYIRGETPLPCVRCNQNVKFKDMLTTARELGADCLATGHYVQSLMYENLAGEKKAQLFKGSDPQKDQSYFLFSTTQDQLDFLRFPLGGLSKAQTRELASRFGLSVAEKPDSQDICFVPNGSYAKIVEKLRPGAIEEGDIVHMDGRVLGHHQGIIHYTIGQRKGLGIGGIKGEGDVEPLYVVKLDAEKHQVIVGPYEALAQDSIDLKEVNWLAHDLIPVSVSESQGLPVQVKIRSIQKAFEAQVFLGFEEGKVTAAKVVFTDAQYGISAGQACVFYQGDRVLGGGWIVAS